MIIFGGCLMFNSKRHLRECINHTLEFDTTERVMTTLRTKGISPPPVKNHCDTAFKSSMIVCGGQFENGIFSTETIVLHLDNYEWIRIALKPEQVQ